MKEIVVNRIVTEMHKSGLCSLISDGTQDESKLEAQCIILLYLEERQAGIRPVEQLIDVFTMLVTSGQVPSEKILSVLEAKNVALQSLVGQSYDGARSVRGKYAGLRTLVLEIVPKVVYI
jgi:hypothetical protein